MGRWYGYGSWAPYVPVAEKKERAERKMRQRRKRGLPVLPVRAAGRDIARSFWGRSWCRHIECFSDIANRLPRGRTYVRNGSVCHLETSEGAVEAFVAGSEVYRVRVRVQPLPAARWKTLRRRCAGRIGSLVEILTGNLSDSVMAVVTHPRTGLFPKPGEMSFSCSCPDGARMCKHVAAVLYGVAARLDHEPEELFLLRGVDPSELLPEAVARSAARPGRAGHVIEEDRLESVFGIDIEEDPVPAPPRSTRARKKAARRGRPKKKKKAARPKKKPQQKAASGPARGRPRARKGEPGKSAAWTAASVRELRRRLRLSVAEFSLLGGFSPSTVYQWERSARASDSPSAPLRLQHDSRDALGLLADLTAGEAQRFLADLRA